MVITGYPIPTLGGRGFGTVFDCLGIQNSVSQVVDSKHGTCYNGTYKPTKGKRIMPRSVVRPNQATKHMAVLLTVREMGMTDLTPTKTNKIPAATLQYLYGYFELPFTTKPSVDALISALNIPAQFILNIRIIEQYHDGKPLPTKYKYNEALEGYRAWLSQVRGDDEMVSQEEEEEEQTDDGTMDLEEYDDHYETVTSCEPIPVPDGVSPESWGYAQRFIQALRLEGEFADVGCHPHLDEGANESEGEGDDHYGFTHYWGGRDHGTL